MHRRGHYGIDFLVLAPVLHGLIPSGHLVLAVLACEVLVIEPLPDYDLRTSVLAHRGTSHSVVTAGIVGAWCAGLGWVLGSYVTVSVAEWLVGSVLVDPGAITWITTHLAHLDGDSLALGGVCVGSGGICLHLLGDVITVSGIQPYLPISRRTVSLSSLRAKNAVVNTGLFVLGVLALVAVGVSQTPLGEWILTVLPDVLREVWLPR